MRAEPMQVKDIMTRDVQVIDPDATLAQGASQMRTFDVGSLPVCKEGRLVGMITDRDIAVRSIAAGDDPNAVKVRDVMTPEMVTCSEDQDITEAASKMEANQIRRLVVLNGERQLVGIVSLGDLSVRTGDKELSGEVLEQVSEPGQVLEAPAARSSEPSLATRPGLTKMIAGIFPDRHLAQRALEDLRVAGLDPQRVSVITRDPARAREAAHETGGEVTTGTAAGFGMGALLGGAAGWLVGVGALAIPGIGPVVAAGPLAAALGVTGATAAVGAGAGATAGGLVGALTGWGFAENEAREYESRVTRGDIFLVAEVTGELTDRAENILKGDGADEVRSSLAAA
jgi:CBS domain-containing protein